MAWINGRWVEDQQGFGGMLGGFGGQPRFAEGYTGDTSLDEFGDIRGAGMGGEVGIGAGRGHPGMRGDWGGMRGPTPQNPFQQPIYGQGPQMQTPFGGGLGDIDQWNPVQTPEFQPFPQPPQLPPSPPQMMPPLDIPGRMPAPGMQPPMPPPRPPVLPPDMIFDPPPDWRPSTDHEFNVAQREKTKTRLAADRAKTKKHYAKLRAKGASKQTIAKAKAKSKARSKKIKGQSVRRRTIKN